MLEAGSLSKMYTSSLVKEIKDFTQTAVQLKKTPTLTFMGVVYLIKVRVTTHSKYTIHLVGLLFF